MDTGTDGSAAHAYILGRDSIILSEARPYGGAYIAGVDIENDGGWTGEIFIFRLYDANGDLDIPQDELVRLGRKSLPPDIVSDSREQLRVQPQGEIRRRSHNRVRQFTIDP